MRGENMPAAYYEGKEGKGAADQKQTAPPQPPASRAVPRPLSPISAQFYQLPWTHRERIARRLHPSIAHAFVCNCKVSVLVDTAEPITAATPISPRPYNVLFTACNY